MSTRNSSELDRRTLLKGAAAGAAVGVAGAAIDPPAAEAEDKHALEDPKITTEMVTIKNGDASVPAFIARPKAAGKHGTVIVTPDIFGMSPYIKETSAQIAQAGLAAFCIDFYRGKTPPGNDLAQLRNFVSENAPDKQIVSDALAGLEYVKKQSWTNGKYGVTGFCMGGRITLLLAASSPSIVAASPYYGPVRAGGPTQMSLMEMTDRIKAAVQGHYGATDVNPKPDDVREFYSKLKQTNPHAEFFIYEGAGHAFHSFGRPSYNAEAATQAWNRTLEFFKTNLS